MPTFPTVPDDVRRWIERQDPAEQDALARTWDAAGLADDPADPDDTRRQAELADEAWLHLARRLDAPEAGAAPPLGAVPTGERVRGRGAPDRALVRGERSARRVRRLTAGALLAAAVVAAVVLWPRWTTVSAGGEVLVAGLPDGSEVTLAPGSTLRYPSGFDGATRRVALDGQAFFDVETAARPFVVETDNARVEVLGTAFDVQAWPGAAETAVALVEGSVRFRSGSGAAVTLDPGEVSRVVGAGAPTPPVPVDVSTVTSWRAGGFAVVDAPLATVAAALEARFGRPVVVGPGVDARRRITLFLPRADSADAVLRDVAAYLDLRLQAGPDGFTLRPR